jgi:hypothetical protein
MKATELYPEGVHYVVERMRSKDRDEVFATQWDEDNSSFANNILRVGDFGFVLHHDDGEPIVCGGAVPMWPGVWSVWMFATDRFDEIAMSTTKFAKRVFFPALEHTNWHRLECRSLASHSVAHRWLESLGAYKESETPNYGKAGETFLVYCWTKERPQAQSD